MDARTHEGVYFRNEAKPRYETEYPRVGECVHASSQVHSLLFVTGSVGNKVSTMGSCCFLFLLDKKKKNVMNCCQLAILFLFFFFAVIREIIGLKFLHLFNFFWLWQFLPTAFSRSSFCNVGCRPWIFTVKVRQLIVPPKSMVSEWICAVIVFVTVSSSLSSVVGALLVQSPERLS